MTTFIKDLIDIPPEVRNDLDIRFIKRIGDAIPLVLEEEVAPPIESVGAVPEPQQPMA